MLRMIAPVSEFQLVLNDCSDACPRKEHTHESREQLDAIQVPPLKR